MVPVFLNIRHMRVPERPGPGQRPEPQAALDRPAMLQAKPVGIKRLEIR